MTIKLDRKNINSESCSPCAKIWLKMILKLKRTLNILLAITVMLAGGATRIGAAGTESHNWYCIRTRDHLRPPCPPELSFVSKYGGYYIDKTKRDDDEDRVVYLTFDAGYENGNVAKILDTLKEKQATGAFFILGNLITSSPDLVRRMADEGHIVGNHTYHHRDMTKLEGDEFAKEISSLEEAYKKATGRELYKYYRPPEGRFSEANLKQVSELGYSTIFWSFAYADWDNNNQPSKDAAVKKILENVHNGAVLLLHPTSKTNADILPQIIDSLRADGYRFGRIDELCAQPDVPSRQESDAATTTRKHEKHKKNGNGEPMPLE